MFKPSWLAANERSDVFRLVTKFSKVWGSARGPSARRSSAITPVHFRETRALACSIYGLLTKRELEIEMARYWPSS